jgi:hypothetical protein
MTGKPKLTPEESIALAGMKDDPDLDAHMEALVARLEDVPHLYLRSMLAGNILGNAENYEDAMHTIERILAMVEAGGFDEQVPS